MQLANEKCDSLDGRNLGKKHKGNLWMLTIFQISPFLSLYQNSSLYRQITLHLDSYAGNWINGVSSSFPTLALLLFLLVNSHPHSLSQTKMSWAFWFAPFGTSQFSLQSSSDIFFTWTIFYITSLHHSQCHCPESSF